MENDKTINDLPLSLVQEILLRLPVKSLLQVRCVCKTWLHLISDPDFAKSHFELAAAPTRRCLCYQRSKALSFDLDALFHDGHTPVKFTLPFKVPARYDALESCRGFILIDKYPNLVIWNPPTGAHKRISYPPIVSPSNVLRCHVRIRDIVLLYGFGYDASKDDYLVVLAWADNNKEEQFHYFSMRNNSWKNFGVALPNVSKDKVLCCGLFFNGAFHWLACPRHRDYVILVFDLNERSFSEISLPEQVGVVFCGYCYLIELEGCLTLNYLSPGEYKREIWVMKEYKVQSSWKLYGKFDMGFHAICLLNDGDIIGFDTTTGGFSKCDVRGQKLEDCSCKQPLIPWCTSYTESLISLPNVSKAKKNGRLLCQECSEQLDSVTNHNHNEIKDRKRIRTAPTWTLDFYCN